MSKTIKRINVLLFAFILLFSVNIVVFAENGDSSLSDSTANSTLVTSGSSFVLTKEIALYNPSSSQIYEPNVKYTYEIQSVDTEGKATITDKDNKMITVRPGVLSAISINYTDNDSGGTDGIHFGQTDNRFNTNAEGSAPEHYQTRTATINVDASKFVSASGVPQPGVFRYSITETMDDATNGIIHKATETLFLDVYIRYEETETELEPYGFVLFRDSTITEKVNGFDSSSTGNALVDEYHTYNATITKTVSGNLGDKYNNFPLQADLDGDNGNAKFWYVVTMDGTEGSPQKVNLTNGEVTIGSASNNGTIALQNSDDIIVYGIPVKTTIDVSEFNNTKDSYTVSLPLIVSGNSSLVHLSSETLAANSVVKTSVPLTVVNNANVYGNVELTFNNALSEVSPTSVIYQYFPYILILLISVILLFFVIRKKNNVNSTL